MKAISSVSKRPLLLVVLVSALSGANIGAQPSTDPPPPSSAPQQQSDAFKDVGYQYLRERREVLQRDIPRIDSEVQSLGTQLLRFESADDELASAKDALQAATSDTSISREERRRLTDRVSYFQSLVKRRERELPALTKDHAAKQRELQEMRKEIDRVEREINRRIDIETPRQDFKKYMSLAFAGLVGVVIVGFFLIAARDETVRRDVFSGQAGLQFITLFALIIAIILFGIVGILEGKELSALLGGLSGYILGRSSSQKPAET